MALSHCSRRDGSEMRCHEACKTYLGQGHGQDRLGFDVSEFQIRYLSKRDHGSVIHLDQNA